MANRVCIGYQPTLGIFGFFMSRAGVNVLTATASSDFLISSSRKNEQIVEAGAINPLGAGASSSINFASTMESIPVLIWQSSHDGAENFMPFNPNGTLTQTYRLSAAVSTTAVTFYNGGNLDLAIRWAALARTRP